ncbi:hypothetical protein ACTHHL_00305 [Aeribacillus composti]|uniref:hypothetical protein n=1 Tax=Aeribacillus TaxID=1055323 RepID=UPI0030D159B1
MKNLLFIMGIAFNFMMFNISSDEVKSYKTEDSTAEEQDLSDIFKNDSYAFALSLQYVDYEDKVVFKNEQIAKQRLKNVQKYLDDLTDHGTSFHAVENLEINDKWQKLVEDVAYLKYYGFDESEILNDLNIAGALILQAENYYDKPSLSYLYQIFTDLNSAINGEKVKYNVTRTFSPESQFKRVSLYLASKK